VRQAWRLVGARDRRSEIQAAGGSRAGWVFCVASYLGGVSTKGCSSRTRPASAGVSRLAATGVAFRQPRSPAGSDRPVPPWSRRDPRYGRRSVLARLSFRHFEGIARRLSGKRLSPPRAAQVLGATCRAIESTAGVCSCCLRQLRPPAMDRTVRHSISPWAPGRCFADSCSCG
jgi:hypothetical protein